MHPKKGSRLLPPPVRSYADILVDAHIVGSPPKNRIFSGSEAVANFIRWNDRATKVGLAQHREFSQDSCARTSITMMG